MFTVPLFQRSLKAVLITLLAAPLAGAQIRLPNALSDHAVLQRGVPVHIWGWATPGDSLTVSLHGQKVSTSVDRLGEWSAWLNPESAGGPYTLTVTGSPSDGSKTITDLLIGDVWLASGQSNMEMPLKGFGPGTPVKNGTAEIAAANNPQIRLLHIETASSAYPLPDVKNIWTLCTPETAANFSAVAYFFGREIAAKEHVPIGLIAAAWGGVPVDSFISLEGLTANSAVLPALANRAHFADSVAQVDEIVAAEKREDAAAQAAGKPAARHQYHPAQASWLPAGPYNAMIAPLNKYTVKGFLWYQGETDASAERAPHYNALFEALITDWRSHFAQGDLPFLFVQLTSFNGGPGWGVVRDAQRRTLALRDTAMAVTLDVGDNNNIHPADKQTVAYRLALAARHMVYGENIASLPPLFHQATTEPGAMRVWLDNAKGLKTSSATVQGFEVAGEDRTYVKAEARIDGTTLVVKNATFTDPKYVRYAWDGIAPPGLYNADGLPTATFTSEP